MLDVISFAKKWEFSSFSFFVFGPICISTAREMQLWFRFEFLSFVIAVESQNNYAYGVK